MPEIRTVVPRLAAEHMSVHNVNGLYTPRRKLTADVRTSDHEVRLTAEELRTQSLDPVSNRVNPRFRTLIVNAPS